MRAAVTGASGFVGRSVTKNLTEHGVEVIPIGRDVTDYSVGSLTKLLRGADQVIHLAAVRGGDGAMADYHDNERITENLLNAMKEAEVKRIIYASSRMVYSGEDRIPWKETDLPTPNSLYGISKLEGENLCSYYGRKYGFRSTAIRIAQVMGPGEKVRNMMSVFLEKALRGEQLKVIGQSRARRQYIYVEDLAEIISRIVMTDDGAAVGQTASSASTPSTAVGQTASSASTPGTQDVINVGMEQAYTNLEIAQIYSEVFGLPRPEYDDSKPETITPSIMDVSRMVSRTGCHPRDMRAAVEAIKQA